MNMGVGGGGTRSVPSPRAPTSRVMAVIGKTTPGMDRLSPYFSGLSWRGWDGLCALAFAFAFVGDEQFKAHQLVAFVAHREPLPRLEGGFVRQTMLGVGNLIDPRRRDHFPRLVDCLGGI
jgi:hypothetical protein